MTHTQQSPSAARSPFGEILVRLRTERGLTQERLASATDGDRLSARSITNYERSAKHPKDWVIPHRPALRALAKAMDLDPVEQHSLITAWSKTRIQRDATLVSKDSPTFIASGRETAVNEIMAAWDRARNGTPQIAFVGGIAGIGKTSLTRHVCDQIAAREKSVMITWGAASSWAAAVEPYLAIRTATDRILSEPDATSNLPGTYPSRPRLGESNIARIMESIPLLAGALMSERALREMAATHEGIDAAAVDTLLATRSSTVTIGRFEEYSLVLAHFSKSWPIVIVLEDLHWAGQPTATLLLHLARRMQSMRNTPILFICTFRNDEVFPESNQEQHPLSLLLNALGHSPQITQVRLNKSMATEEGVAFIRGIVQQTLRSDSDNQPELVTWLYEQTSGHPLLTGEMLRHLLETGALKKSGAGAGWLFDLAQLPPHPPVAVSNFVEQRLNRVDDQSRRILEIASVMDDTVLTEIIADVLEAEEESILDVIDEQLVDLHQLMLPDTPMQFRNQSYTSYRFPHALFREHVYGHLQDHRRKRLHQAIARAMENRFVNADTTELSEITSHYILAEDWQNAQRVGYRLAQLATLKLDWDLAAMWFPQAEELAKQAEDPEQLWRARAARLAVLRGTGEYDEAIKLGERILRRADSHNWPETFALAHHHLGEVYFDLGKIDQAVESLTKAIELHLQENTLDLAAAGEAMLSHATHRQGKYDVARKHAQIAQKYSRELENTWVHPEAVLAAANCETDLGFYTQAIDNYQVAIELATMIGKVSNQFIPALNIGLCQVQLGDYQLAIDGLQPLNDHMESQQLIRLVAISQLYLGYAYEGAGQYDAAARAYARSTDIRRNTSQAPTLFDSLAGVLRVAVKQGDDRTARLHLGEIATHIESNGWEGIEDPLLVKLTVAKTHAHFDNSDGYRDYITRAHDLVMHRAGMLSDEEAKSSYLTNVPVNVEIQERYAAL